MVHARDDRVVPVEEGRLLAALIPDARLVLLESANHILLADEPAWKYFTAELDAFLGTTPVRAPHAPIPDLSARESEVLELVAAGLANEAIAERLYISVRTVERHLPTSTRSWASPGRRRGPPRRPASRRSPPDSCVYAAAAGARNWVVAPMPARVRGRTVPGMLIATHEIRGGRGLRLHAREWGDPQGPACSSSTAGRRATCAGQSRSPATSPRGSASSRSTCAGTVSDKPTGPEHYADGQLWRTTWRR